MKEGQGEESEHDAHENNVIEGEATSSSAAPYKFKKKDGAK